MTTSHDVLVVGGGPAGASCAYWLAEAGYDVLLVEKKRYPREKTCGDGLTPRSVKQLNDMGLAGALAGHHRFDGLRSIAFGRTLELRWPDHPDFPTYGYVVTRKDLDSWWPSGPRRRAPPSGRSPRRCRRCWTAPPCEARWCGARTPAAP